jgi:hypothetical protein
MGDRASARNPVPINRCPLSGSTAAIKSVRPSVLTRTSNAAATSKSAAPAMNTALTFSSATSAPASSGPAKVPTLSTVDVAPFDAMSSSGVRASDGSSACNAGRMSVDAMPTTAPSANTRRRSPAKDAAADAASAPAPTIVIARRKRSRRNRWPSDAANGASTPAGNRRTSPATPTAEAPPCS